VPVTVVAEVAGRHRYRVPLLRARPEIADALDRALHATSGVRAVRIYPRSGSVVIWTDPTSWREESLRGLLEADLPVNGGSQTPAVHGDDLQAARLVVGAGVLVALAVRRWLLRRPPLLSGRSRTVTTAIAIFTGYPFFRGALRGFRDREGAGTDALVAAATVASLILRENIATLTILWLLNIGEFLQDLTLRRTRRAIANLLSPHRGHAWLVTESGQEVQVPAERLEVGDVVVVYEHNVLSVDGVVLDGEGVVEQAALTGESFPVYRTANDTVFAGTTLVQGRLVVKAASIGRDTAVGRIISRVEEAEADRAPIETLATSFSRRFVPASFALAGVTWLLTGDARRAMTMLLVACPCAAGLSTPTAVSAAIGNGARRGILIKGGSHLEGAGRVSAVVFDKTGTLTRGKPVVTDVVALDKTWSPERVLAYAASSEIHARHPLAQAVIRHTEEQRVEIPPHEECEVLLGLGMRVVAGANRLLLGSPELMQRYNVPLGAEAVEWIERMREAAETPLCLAVNGGLVGLIGVTDELRPEARETVAALRELGVARIVMVTGDAEGVASVVAERLGIDEWRAHALPEEKLDVVRELQREGRLVAVVGDGVNDAPALAAADIGVAMGISATDVAVETADVALAGDQLRSVVEVVELGRRTLHVVRQNYALAIGVNTVGLLAGSVGRLSPLLAAVLHNASSVAVVANSSRLIRFRVAPPA
jgi:cation-transporting P-type ATPase C